MSQCVLQVRKAQDQQQTGYQHGWTYMEGLLATARIGQVGLGVVVCCCVHVNVHLHLVIQDLHKLLHGGQLTRLELRPHWHIYLRRKENNNATSL